jgi:metal-responsive CopG/Arc/MetJ family transcriptional regulator
MVSITISLPEELYERVREYCKRHEIKISHLVQKLIEVGLPILEERDRQKEVVAK